MNPGNGMGKRVGGTGKERRDIRIESVFLFTCAVLGITASKWVNSMISCILFGAYAKTDVSDKSKS